MQVYIYIEIYYISNKLCHPFLATLKQQHKFKNKFLSQPSNSIEAGRNSPFEMRPCTISHISFHLLFYDLYFQFSHWVLIKTIHDPYIPFSQLSLYFLCIYFSLFDEQCCYCLCVFNSKNVLFLYFCILYLLLFLALLPFLCQVGMYIC